MGESWLKRFSFRKSEPVYWPDEAVPAPTKSRAFSLIDLGHSMTPTVDDLALERQIRREHHGQRIRAVTDDFSPPSTRQGGQDG